MATLFSKIVAGEIPCYKVAESDYHLAFLDIFPLQRGHVLCITKRENDYIFDLADDELAELMVFAKRVAKAIDSVTPQTRVGIAVVGLEVPHTHVHLIPIDSVADMSFSREKLELGEDEMKKIAVKISTAYAALD